MNDDKPTTRHTKETIETEEQGTEPIDQDNRSVFKGVQVVWYIAGVLITLLLIRVVLAALGANLDNAFANFIYVITDPFVAPFRGLLQVGEFQAGVSRFEIETLFASLVYALAAWGIVKAIMLTRK